MLPVPSGLWHVTGESRMHYGLGSLVSTRHLLQLSGMGTARAPTLQGPLGTLQPSELSFFIPPPPPPPYFERISLQTH